MSDILDKAEGYWEQSHDAFYEEKDQLSMILLRSSVAQIIRYLREMEYQSSCQTVRKSNENT